MALGPFSTSTLKASNFRNVIFSSLSLHFGGKLVILNLNCVPGPPGTQRKALACNESCGCGYVAFESQEDETAAAV
jgi:hypothetical protein